MGLRCVVLVLAGSASTVSGCGSFGTVAVEDAGGDASVEPPADASSEAATDAAGDAAKLPVTKSCKLLLARVPSLQGTDGIYEIDPDDKDDRPPFRAYCDMTIDGGGWTLVGRSAPGALPRPFGWRRATGKVENRAQPYSLDVVASSLGFDEILIADTTPQDTHAHAFKLARPADFFTKHGDDTVQSGPIVTVLGDCAPDGGPTMLRHSGGTSFDDVFFFRDVADDSQHLGLKVDGFALVYQDCDRGAALDGAQGMVLVR